MSLVEMHGICPKYGKSYKICYKVRSLHDSLMKFSL